MTDVSRSLVQALSDILRVAFLYMTLAFLMLVMMCNWVLPYFAVIKPEIFLIVIFYWTLYRPGIMPYWVMFLTGLVLDLVNPVLPLGTHSLSFLLIAGILRPRRRMLMGQPFMMVWIAFILTVILNLTLIAIILSLTTSHSINMTTLGINAISTILAFPLVLMMMVGLHRTLPPSRGMIAS